MDYIVNESAGAVNSAPNSEKSLNEGYMGSQDSVEVVSTPQTEPETVEEQKPYTFRKLNSTDLFLMTKLISKIGLDELSTVLDKNVLKNLVDKTMNETDSKDDAQFIVGFDVVLKLTNKILEHIPDCQREIYTLLSNVSGMNEADLKQLDLAVFAEMILDFVTKEEFKDFFKVASKFVKRLG
jgi:phosphotransferase system IIB component